MSFALVGGRPYQIAFALLRAPQTIGWVALGFALDRSVAQQSQEIAMAQFQQIRLALLLIGSLALISAIAVAL